jgi:excisionase family DNA binding protein
MSAKEGQGESMTTEEKEWLTMREAAEYIGVSYERYTRAAKKGELPVIRVPGFKRKYKVRRVDLEEVMRQSGLEHQ